MAEYGGLFGAFRYAFGRSRSLLFRSYVAVSAVVGAYVSVLLVLGVVTWTANPAGLVGEKALLGVVGILVLVPLFAPVLLVARRHRLERGRRRADLLFGLAGYAFVASVVLALLITDPNDHPAAGPAGAVLAAIDSLPRTSGLLPPVAGAALIALVERLTRA